MDYDLLYRMIEEGYVTVRRHPVYPIFVYNYTAAAQYGNVWNDVTLACRGLVMDENLDVVARGFRKFFNIEQVAELPNLPFSVTEKMDGSLGIVFKYQGSLIVCTRGSFDSEQAQRAYTMLEHDVFEEGYSYLFEIIYPENRVVVDYHGAEMMVLLAIMDKDGNDCPIPENFPYPVVKSVKCENISDLKNMNLSNFEGFVVRFSNGFRVKIKLSEYVRLHALMSDLNEKRILTDYLMLGKPAGYLSGVPDEVFKWFSATVEYFEREYKKIEDECKTLFAQAPKQTRKDFAVFAVKTKHSSVLFKMLDGQDYSNLIWKMLLPLAKTVAIFTDEA